MINVLATHELRRLPALLLVSCLLMMGVPVTSAPVPDGSSDGMSAPALGSHAQVVRAAAQRAGSQPVPDAGVVPTAGFAAAREWVVRESAAGAIPATAPRSAPRTSYLSRAPPASV